MTKKGELVVTGSGIPALQTAVSEKVIRDFLFTSTTKLTEQEQNLFLNIAVQNNLNPFKREIHCIKYGSDFNIVTGFEVYLKRAENTGQLDGWSCEAIYDGEKLVGARTTIHRKDFEHPFIWDVSMKEFGKNQATWKSIPEFMIKKVCIGQAFRLCFPNELGSLPYIGEEIHSITQEPEPTDKASATEPKAKTKAKPASVKETKPDYKGLMERFEVAKRTIGKENYYNVLTDHGLSHANEIEKIDDGLAILDEMRALIQPEITG